MLVILLEARMQSGKSGKIKADPVWIDGAVTYRQTGFTTMIAWLDGKNAIKTFLSDQ